MYLKIESLNLFLHNRKFILIIQALCGMCGCLPMSHLIFNGKINKNIKKIKYVKKVQIVSYFFFIK